MAVSGKVPESVQHGGRAMRDHPLLGLTFPGERLGCQLQPRGAQSRIVGEGRSRKVVDPGTHPLDEGGLMIEAMQRCPRDSLALCLAAREKPPLVLCQIR